MKLPTPIADVIDDIKTAQDTLTENARALARLTLRMVDGEDALTLASLRDSTADAVKRLEHAWLALLPNVRQEEQMNKNTLAEQAARIARGKPATGEQTWRTLQAEKEQGINRRTQLRAIAVVTVGFLLLALVFAAAQLLRGC